MLPSPSDYYRAFTANTGEVTLYGEVATPRALVLDMLASLPSAVWSNPALKWYEPACGLAPFLYEVYVKLMTTLVAVLPDNSKRSQHIVENMLIFNELQEKNLRMLKQLFRGDIYHLNLFAGDCLTSQVEADIIICNPPYNKIGSKNSGNAEWMRFSRHLVTHARGYLLLVHPAGWRKPESEKAKNKGLFTLLAHSNQLLVLEMYDAAAGKQTFGCGTNYDWYLLEKKACYTSTRVRDTKGGYSTLDLRQWQWLPNFAFDRIRPLLSDTGTEVCCEVLYSRSAYASDKEWVRTCQDDTYKYPVVKTTPRTGTRYLYSRVADRGFYGISKVIFGDSNFDTPVIDMEGVYAMGENAMALVVTTRKDAEEVVTALQSKELRELLRSACLWGNFRLDWRVFTYLKRGFWRVFL